MELKEETRGYRVWFSNSRLLNTLVLNNAKIRELEQQWGRHAELPMLDDRWRGCFKPRIIEFFEELAKDPRNQILCISITNQTQMPLLIEFRQGAVVRRVVNEVKRHFKTNY